MPDALYRKAVSEIWSRFKNKFRVPRYADLPAINSPTPSSTSAPWSCAAPSGSKTTATRRFRPFLHGKRFLICLEGSGRYSVIHLGLIKIVSISPI